MRYISSILSYFIKVESARRNLRVLMKFLVVLAVLIVIYSIGFHFLMASEGKEYSWITGLYWTLTVMSTLGFGDITFHTDLGRIFSIAVLMTGLLFLLTLFPFSFIRFFYVPWMEAESRSRTPRELPGGIRGHVIITSYDPVTQALMQKLENHGCRYVLVVEDLRRALELHDEGLKVAVGFIDDPETYRKMRVDQAALVVATNTDKINTNIAFTVRELNEHVPILTTADSPHSVDILQMAGSSRVLQIYDMLGHTLAKWTVGGDCRSTIITELDGLILAQSAVAGTPLVGKTLAECRLRENFGVSVVGIWEQGLFKVPSADNRIETNSALVLAGSRENIAAFDDVYSLYHIWRRAARPVIIIGAGRVGISIAGNFKERDIEFVMVDKNPQRQPKDDRFVLGDAADIQTLENAGIKEAASALLTTHDDATNIYLTKYLRSLKPDIQILSRANIDRNVSSLHRAGADFVMSYSSLGAGTIFNLFRNEATLMPAEGLNVFRVEAPESLRGSTLAASGIRENTGCSVIAIKADGVIRINPGPQDAIERGAVLMLIGSYEAERRFLNWVGH